MSGSVAVTFELVTVFLHMIQHCIVMIFFPKKI